MFGYVGGMVGRYHSWRTKNESRGPGDQCLRKSVDSLAVRVVFGLTGTSQSDVCSTTADVSCVDIAVATVQDRTRCMRMYEGRVERRR
jgi:hypothetical protein